MDGKTTAKLHKLRAYLENLPDTIPIRTEVYGIYSFDFFNVDDEDMKDLGVEGVVNRQLEVRLGHRRDGPVVFRERGPGLTEVVTVLESHLTQLSGSVILLKWLDDLIEAAIQAYQKARCPLPNVPGIELDTPAASNDSAASNGPTRTGKLDTKILQSFEDPDYVDLPEIDDSRRSGGKLLPLLVKVSRRCQKKNYHDGEKQVDRIRCIGSRGCKMSWAYPRNRQRVLTHVSKCNWLPSELCEAALAQMSENAVGPDAVISEPSPTATVADSSQHPQALPKKDLFQPFVREGRRELKEKVDYALMQYIVCCGIPPSTVDVKEFKQMVSTLNNSYDPPSSSTLTSKLIPNEAAKLSLSTKKYLAQCRHLTITFDGGKTRKNSVYTIHVTTSDRRTFCLDMDDGSRLSHSSTYILEALDQVITSIGPWKFAAVSSDNAGNTRKARKLLCERSPNILNLQDACHLLNLAIKAIVLLPEFEEITYQIRGILAFMSRSSYAMENFDSQRVRLGISRGLEGIGETRFGTIYWAGRSLQCGLPALRAIVEDAVLGITIGTFNNQFVDGREKLEFEFELAKFLSVIAPWAKALKCLEGAHITPDTVYLYWLAIIATIEEDLKRNPYKLRTSTMEEIRAITNSRFEEMIEDAPNDTYIVAFFLNPLYRTAPVYKNNSPLTVPTVSISTRGPLGASCTAKAPVSILARVGISLQKMLQHEYGNAYTNPDWPDPKKRMEIQNPLLAQYHPADALWLLKEQLVAYSKSLDPFDRSVREKTECTLDWWVAVQKDEGGSVLGALALKLFSAVPISMADERTMSMLTWLNAPRRNAQHIGTLQDHIKIRQWHRYKPENKKTPFRPVVYWRDIDTTISGLKRKASELEEELDLKEAGLGGGPSQPRPFDHPLHYDSDSDFESNEATESNPAAPLDGTDQIDDGIRWLNKKRGLRGKAVCAERRRLTVAGLADVDLTSSFFRNILEDAPKSQSQTPGTSKSSNNSPATSSQIVPKASEWASW